jgi:hypothetical protein
MKNAVCVFTDMEAGIMSIVAFCGRTFNLSMFVFYESNLQEAYGGGR